jgi:hypothetical protein
MSLAKMASAGAYVRSCMAVGTAFLTGDVLCQRIGASSSPAERTEATSEASSSPAGFQWDAVRTAQFALVGTTILGPASHTLELLLEKSFPGATVRPIAQKVASRVAVAPLFLSLNFGSLALLRGQDVRAALESKVFPAWQTGSLFWPAVAAITYRFVPLTARPATGAVVGTIWSSYLSWVAHMRGKSHTRLDAPPT